MTIPRRTLLRRALQGCAAAAIGAVGGLLPGCGGTSTGAVTWTTVRSLDELEAAIAAAEGRPMIVSIWALWCLYCIEYHRLMQDDASIREQLTAFHRIKLDVTDEVEMIEARKRIGQEDQAQPYIAFLDAQGTVQPELALPIWYGEETSRRLADSLRTAAG